MINIDKYLRKIIAIALRIINVSLDEAQIDSLVQFFKFCIVGVTNTFISYYIYIMVLFVLRPYMIKIDYVLANLIAFFISVLWSFYWNNRFVFKVGEGKKRRPFPALIKTYISYGFTGIILTNILSYLWIDIIGISKYVAPLINLIVSVPLNYVINKKWAFSSNNCDDNNSPLRK